MILTNIETRARQHVGQKVTANVQTQITPGKTPNQNMTFETKSSEPHAETIRSKPKVQSNLPKRISTL